MYTYEASSTGLDSVVPAWAHEGDQKMRSARLQNSKTRAQMKSEIEKEWELSGRSGEKILLISFVNPKLRQYIGKTLAEVARERGKSPAETAVDLIMENDGRIGAVYFTISEDNIKREIQLPWVSFGSDAGSIAPEGSFLLSNVHPRAYGNFARLLGKYVREEKVIPLAEAIRKLTSLPANNLHLDRRGLLKAGYFADVVVFNPATISDHATFANPHQYATGVRDVFVNGVAVLRNGEHTGKFPGRALRPQTPKRRD
jgi:N-acyl-D-amino-acid deacylase